MKQKLLDEKNFQPGKLQPLFLKNIYCNKHDFYLKKS